MFAHALLSLLITLYLFKIWIRLDFSRSNCQNRLTAVNHYLTFFWKNTMANYCDFVIDVQGEAESLDRFARYFMDSIKEDAGNPRNDVFVPLDDGTFGDFDEKTDVPYLCLSKGKEIQRTESGDIRIIGWCKWETPITWLENVSNLMPGVSFSVQAVPQLDSTGARGGQHLPVRGKRHTRP
jgi:hypothetical protein